MNKIRNNELIRLADQALRQDRGLFDKPHDAQNFDIKDSYNGQIAALSVGIAMTGLRPTLAIYYKKSDTDKKNGTAVDRRIILDIIAKMIRADSNHNLENAQDDDFKDATSLFNYALKELSDDGLKKLTREVEDCAVALKEVVRTYNLI